MKKQENMKSNNISLKPIKKSHELIHELLIKQGSSLKYQEWISLRTLSKGTLTHMIKSVKKNECSAKICGEIKNNSNAVHCVAPECTSDPHHYKNYGLSYWCPECKIHSKSTMRCADVCNNCQIHGSECIRYKNDISCPAINCVNDPHHHNGAKKNHKLCDKCLKCHVIDKKMKYCNICAECNIIIHCSATKCLSDPHHMKKKSEHMICSKCLECHDVSLQFCDQCKVCYTKYLSVHCIDPSCKKDPHHSNEDDYYSYCINCNECHELSLQGCLTSSIQLFPTVLTQIIIETLVGEKNMENEMLYCPECKKCEYLPHCKSNECTIDPHHIKKINKDSKNNDKYCNICCGCHSIKYFACPICNDCYLEENYVHCKANDCASDPHHTSSHKCYISGCNILNCPAIKESYCMKCEKCHVLDNKNIKYCKSCNVCYDTTLITLQHCVSPSCNHDPHHVIRNITKTIVKSMGMTWFNIYESQNDSEYWCNVCNLHWQEKSKDHNKHKCNYFESIKKDRAVHRIHN